MPDELYVIAQEMRASRGDLEKLTVLYDRLFSFPAKEGYSIAVGCELLGRLEEIEIGIRSQLGLSPAREVASRLLERVIRLIDQHPCSIPRKQRKERKTYYMDLSRYLNGESVNLDLMTSERWGVLKQQIEEQLKVDLQAEVLKGEGSELSSLDRLIPVVNRLQRSSMDALDANEVEGKDAVKLFGDMLKLQAELKGELKRNMQVEVGPTEAFVELVREARDRRAEIESRDYELIE